MPYQRYPSIEQFRTIIKQVQCATYYAGKDADGNAIYDTTRTLPTLIFTGTEKLHGTNAAVGVHIPTNTQWAQSRERIITPEEDNAGFAKYISETDFTALFTAIAQELTAESILIYGEWCGGSIQKGVAIAQLPKMFIIFDIRVQQSDGEHIWLSDRLVAALVEKFNFLSVYQFSTYSIEIDFNCPELQQNTLRELTEQVELESPTGKYFGVSGLGEGIVWKHEKYIFKVKGEKHSSSKVRTLAAVDIERLNTITECVDTFVTENRLQQGICHLQEQGLALNMSNLGTFIKWVSTDVMKEEADTLLASGLSMKDIGSSLSKKAKSYYLTHY